MIASFYEGRVRIRTHALKNPATLSMVEQFVKGQEGVLDIAANSRTGSLLVHYDPSVISRECLSSALHVLEAQLAESPAPERTMRKRRNALSPKAESAALVGLYSLTLAGAFVNSRLHTATALLFTLCAGLHLYKRRAFLREKPLR